jgi:serine/threonine protein kinase
MTELTGKTIHGYEIREQIGAGGYGAIYKAYQPAVNREVAIKIILPNHAGNPLFAQRFEIEAQLVAQLEHPHIIPLHDYWHDEDGAFLVMRYVKGGSLRNLLQNQRMLPLAQTVRLLSQIAEALSVAHDAGVIHRDLKPDNILLDERGNAYLTDFGIAKHLGSEVYITGTDEILGTPAYLAPEQIQGQGITPRTDIYALGVMLYEMLTGAHPFADTPLGMLVVKNLQEPLPPIQKERTDLPTAIDTVIQQATAKDPARRYGSALALAEAFHTAANLTPPTVETRRDDSGERTFVLMAGQRPPTPPEQHTPTTPEERNRHAMLQNVRSFWIEGVLENSLHGAALLELGMKQATSSVEHPWHTLLHTPTGAEQTLPPGTQILDLFDKLNGKLLILGDPGSGKTTTLLELARDLLYRAMHDKAHPLPIVFNLSSWAEARKSLAEWLIDELRSKYQVPKRIAQEWVESDALLLLLDGLDEVTANDRDACVAAINAYRKEHGFVDVVVCSRIRDYEALTNQLKLNGAIVLQPLKPDQVESYLTNLGPQTATLRTLLGQHATLQEMSHSPLMLSIMALAYQDTSTKESYQSASAEAWGEHLFELYVRRMFQRRLGVKPYTPEQTTSYLSWLAHQMTEHAQSEFLIEKMQPSWLTEGQRQQFQLTARVISVVTQALVWALTFIIIIVVVTGEVDWLTALSLGVAGAVWGLTNTVKTPTWLVLVLIAVVFWWAAGIQVAVMLTIAVAVSLYLGGTINPDTIETKEVLRFSWAQAKKELIVIGFLFGVIQVVITQSLVEITPEMVLSTVGSGAAYALLFVLSSGFTSGDVSRTTRPNQGIHQSLLNGIRMGSMLMFLLFLAIILPQILYHPATSIARGVALAVPIGFGLGLLFGGFAVIQHAILRHILYRDGLIPRNYAHFLDYTASLILLRKVGGGYIFVHRMLMDYFVALASERKTASKDDN